MERLFSATSFPPEFIFGGLKGEIIDYVISSYMVNMSLIRLYYWHPSIQIHCGEAYQVIDEDKPFLHIHKVEAPGIYHAKFVIITTTEVLRLIVMTTNITNQLVENCLNDYYVVEIPKCKLSPMTPFVQGLNTFFATFGITFKKTIMQYDWRGIHAKLLMSLPNGVNHAMCWKNIRKPNTRGTAKITASTGMLGFDIKKILGVQKCTFCYLKDRQKRTDVNWLLYDLEHNKKTDKEGKPVQNYELEEIESIPFHIKRYEIEFIKKKKTKKWQIVTSANLTKQAWGTLKDPAKNVELGIAWNYKS